MAENLDVPGRLAVRTPMQWTGAEGGGFSKAAKRKLTRPLPDGLFGPQRVNAADQRRDHESFWWFMRDLIYTFRAQPQLGWSTPEVLQQPHGSVLAHLCREPDSGWMMLALHNFGPDGCLVPVELTDVPPDSVLVDLLDGLSECPLDGKGRAELELGAYGYRWLRVLRPGEGPII